MALSAKVLEKLNFMQPKAVVKTIDGKDWEFFAFRMRMVHELLSVSKPIASAVSILLQGERNLRGIKSKIVTTEDKKAGFNQTTQDTDTPAADLEHLKYRQVEKTAAIDSLFDAVTGKDSKNLIARMVMDSLRKEFDANPSEDEVAAFWGLLNLAQAMAMIGGAMEANATVIRPFLEKAGWNLRGEATKAVREMVADKLGIQLTPAPVSGETIFETSEAASSSSSVPSEEALV